MRPLGLALFLACLGTAKAQDHFSIDPNSVDLKTKQVWCQAQFNTCGTICSQKQGDATVNTCNAIDLKYQCKCVSGYSPPLEYYANTVPTLICNKYNQDCISAAAGDSDALNNCTETVGRFCGQSPGDTTIQLPGTTSSSSSSSTSSPASSPTNTNQSSPPEPPPDVDDGGGLNREAKVGIGVGVPLAILVIVLPLGWYFRRKRSRDEDGGPAPAAPEDTEYKKTELEDTQLARHAVFGELHGQHTAEMDAVAQPGELATANLSGPHELAGMHYWPSSELGAEQPAHPHETGQGLTGAHGQHEEQVEGQEEKALTPKQSISRKPVGQS